MHASRLILIALLAFTLVWAVPTHGGGEASTLVKDINTTTRTLPNISNFTGFIKVLGNQALFLANDTEHGTELWRSDGTTTGTQLLADLNPGPASVRPLFPNQEVVAGSRLFFFVSDNSNTTLWVSDGTTAGTRRINSAKIGSPSELTAVNDNVFFVTSDPQNQIAQLWMSDGTTITNTKTWASTDAPRTLAAYGNSLLFAQRDSVYGAELWRSDGTEAGTQRITDLNPGVADSFGWFAGTPPPKIVTLGDHAYFFADDGTGRSLWKSDVTIIGTTKVQSVAGIELEQAGSFLFFQAAHTVAGQTNNWLWKSDGTNAGTTPFHDYGFAPQTSSNPAYVSFINSKYYFSAIYHFVSDTNISTQLSTYGTPLYTPPEGGYVGDGVNVFFRGGGITDVELWVTEGTTQTTRRVLDINPNYYSTPKSLTMLGNQVLFYAYDGTTIDIWKSSGTEQGTTKLRDQSVPTGVDTQYQYYQKFAGFQMTNIGSKLVFTANNGADNPEPWVSDGTSAGTELLKEIDVTQGSLPLGMISFGGKAYFAASTGQQTNIWQTDGTTAGTSIFRSTGSTPIEYQNELWYTHYNGTNVELWRSTGNGIGTLAVSLPAQTSIIHLLATNDILYFITFIPNSTNELWKSDGTQAGTVKLKTITTSGSGSTNRYRHFAVRGNSLFFIATYNSFVGPPIFEFWGSDGTEDGTLQLAWWGPLYTSTGTIPRPVVVGNKVYLDAPASNSSQYLLATDGTISGTVTIKTFAIPYNDSTVRSLANLNGTLLFAANDGTHGIELWKSDGTEAGTVLLKDINLGIFGSGIDNLRVIGNVVYFSAGDGVTGTALWRTDGTATGTVKVAEIAEGPSSADPKAFTLVGNQIFFVANEPATGQELHAISAVIEYRAHLPSVLR